MQKIEDPNATDEEIIDMIDAIVSVDENGRRCYQYGKIGGENQTLVHLASKNGRRLLVDYLVDELQMGKYKENQIGRVGVFMQ